MISTFQVPFKVNIEIDGLTAIFEDREAAKGSGMAIAVRYESPGWFTRGLTAFLVVLEGGKVGWVESRFCNVPPR
jgi:hypothetical protein